MEKSGRQCWSSGARSVEERDMCGHWPLLVKEDSSGRDPQAECEAWEAGFAHGLEEQQL